MKFCNDYNFLSQINYQSLNLILGSWQQNHLLLRRGSNKLRTVSFSLSRFLVVILFFSLICYLPNTVRICLTRCILDGWVAEKPIEKNSQCPKSCLHMKNNFSAVSFSSHLKHKKFLELWISKSSSNSI